MKKYLNTTLLLFVALFCCKLSAKNVSGLKVSSCEFEGPYYETSTKDKIQKGCQNNYTWGKKDIILSRGRGLKGFAQKVDIRGISSGAFQFFFTQIRLKNGKYYRVSFDAKGEGFVGKMAVYIRKIGYPWKSYLDNHLKFLPTSNWKRYSFGGMCTTDVDRDLGVMFQTGSLGRFWLDNLKIEEFDTPPEKVRSLARKVVKGNLFPRSSFEGEKDYFWSNGIYSLPEGEWEDPQIYRAAGGKFGKFSMAIPSSINKGSVFCRSYYLPVANGNCYTFSAWLKSSKKSAEASLQLFGNDHKSLGYKRVKIGPEWKRFTLTTKKLSSSISDVYAAINVSQQNGTVFVDGIQLEVGEKATVWTPKYPFELYARFDQLADNITHWGKKLPLKILIAASQKSKSLSQKRIPVKLKIQAYPDITVVDKIVNLLPGKEFNLEIDTKHNGLFRVSLSPVDKKVASFQEIIFARLPKPRQIGKDSAFGTHFSIRPFFINYAWKIGMKWLRLHDGSAITKWRCAERDKGKIVWYDKQVNAVLDRGMNILGLPDGPPQWAKLPKGSKNIIDLKAFEKYCMAIAEHYKGRIDYWEAWNEPFMVGFFPGTPQQYGKVFEIANSSLRSGNPKTKILGFCTQLSGIDFVKKIPARYRKDIDILSFHCYFSNLTGGGTMSSTSELNAYKKLFGKDDPGKYWNTEGANFSLGKNSFYSFRQDKNLNKRAVAFCSRVWVEQRKANFDKLFIYTLHQGDTVKHNGNFKTLIDFDRSVTPGAVATAVTAWCIDGMSVKKHKKIKGLVQGLFSDDKCSTWVVYKDPLATKFKTINLDKIPGEIEIYDTMGNDPRNAKIKKYKIGIEPLFFVTNHNNAKKLLKICQRAVK